MAENTIANRTLFIADNLDVLRGMNSATIDLIYLDPPFNSGKEWSAPVGSLAAGAAFKDAWTLDDVKEEWVDEIEERNPALHYTIRAAGFTSSPSMQGYLTYMAVRLLEMQRVLKPEGSIWLHCDDTASHYLKIVMDAVFGARNYRNEVAWKRTSAHNDSRRFGRVSDTLLFYGGTDIDADAIRLPLDEGYVQRFYRHEDEHGAYRAGDLTGAGVRHGETGQAWRGINPTRVGRHWAVPIKGGYADWIEANVIPGYQGIVSVMARLDALDSAGLIVWPTKKADGVPQLKRYIASSKGQVPSNIWDDIMPVSASSKEATSYPTQKPLALLERVIKASSKEGDLVLDPFCGCATTCVAAERLGREWIGIDVSEKAYDLVVSRLAKDAQVGSVDLSHSEQQPIGLYGQAIRRMDLPKRTDLPPVAKGGKSPNIKSTLYAAQGGKCNGCEWAMPVHALAIDHIHPKAAEGPDVDSNLQLLCPSCNSIKGSRIMTIEQLREETTKKGTNVSCGEKAT